MDGVFLASRFNGANFTSSSLRNAQIGDRIGVFTAGASFRFADLEGAAFFGGNHGVEANSTDFTGARLVNVTFDGGSFIGSNFTDADLTGATFFNDSLGEVTWSNTTCPDGTNSDDHGGSCEGHLTP